jgi:hypothetical protein
METWPPSPTNEHPEPSTKLVKTDKTMTGYAALACSAATVLIRIAMLLHIGRWQLGMLSLLLVSVGTVLGIISRSTLAGRLALLGPIFFVILFIYYMLCWYRVLPYY